MRQWAGIEHGKRSVAMSSPEPIGGEEGMKKR
jgi:hypothetical protein